MKVTMLLADYAKVSDGKLDILGGGWSLVTPHVVPDGRSQIGPTAIALLIQVPWDQSNTKHKMKMELLDADGQVLTVETNDGEGPVGSIEGEFEVGRPPGMKPGTPIDVPLAIPVPPLQIPPGERHEWRLHIDGKTREDWTLAFTTRPLPPQAIAA